MERIAQIRTWDGSNMVHHVFEAEPDKTWIDGPNGRKVPNWPPTPSGPVLLVNVTGQGVNEGDGYNPETHKCIPMPVAEWDDESYQWDITTRPEADVSGVSS